MEDRNRSSIETATARRIPLKARSNFNDYTSWKHKLRENCFRRVREDRSHLLWKMRLPASQTPDSKDVMKDAFRDIVSDELKKIRSSAEVVTLKTPDDIHELDDVIWEYDGLHNAYQGDCEEILLEMQKIFYDDLYSEHHGKESKSCVEIWEDVEDEYLARAVYEHMQLNEEQVKEKIWCPVCKQGQLLENHNLVYCTICELKLSKGSEVNLELVRLRLAAAHSEHLDRGCRLKPNFSIETIFDLTALYIGCPGCQTFEVVI